MRRLLHHGNNPAGRGLELSAVTAPSRVVSENVHARFCCLTNYRYSHFQQHEKDFHLLASSSLLKLISRLNFLKKGRNFRLTCRY
jgi:hypothetical protein